MYCVCEESLSPDKDMFTLYNQIQLGEQALSKSYTKACLDNLHENFEINNKEL